MLNNQLFDKILELESIGINEASVKANKSRSYFSTIKIQYDKKGKCAPYGVRLSALIAKTFPKSTKCILNNDIYFNHILNYDLNCDYGYDKENYQAKRKKLLNIRKNVTERIVIQIKNELKEYLSDVDSSELFAKKTLSILERNIENLKFNL